MFLPCRSYLDFFSFSFFWMDRGVPSSKSLESTLFSQLESESLKGRGYGLYLGGDLHCDLCRKRFRDVSEKEAPSSIWSSGIRTLFFFAKILTFWAWGGWVGLTCSSLREFEEEDFFFRFGFANCCFSRIVLKTLAMLGLTLLQGAWGQGSSGSLSSPLKSSFDRGMGL